MNTLAKLHKIEQEKTIYNIHYCKAGVGFIFYEPPTNFEITEFSGKDEWRKYLKVDTYYSTFVKAVNAEYINLYP